METGGVEPPSRTVSRASPPSVAGVLRADADRQLRGSVGAEAGLAGRLRTVRSRAGGATYLQTQSLANEETGREAEEVQPRPRGTGNTAAPAGAVSLYCEPGLPAPVRVE